MKTKVMEDLMNPRRKHSWHSKEAVLKGPSLPLTMPHWSLMRHSFKAPGLAGLAGDLLP